jgi:hypothetical protein
MGDYEGGGGGLGGGDDDGEGREGGRKGTGHWSNVLEVGACRPLRAARRVREVVELV